MVSGAAHASGAGAHSNTSGADYLEKSGLTYEIFEISVEHADLETCPAQFDPDKVFCRLTVAAEQAHVFVFLFEGDQPLLAVQHYELSNDFLPF